MQHAAQAKHASSKVPPVSAAPSARPQSAPAQPPLTYDIAMLLFKVAGVVAAFVLVFSFVFGAFRYADPSMAPAIKDGDMVLTYRLDKDYIANDVVAFDYRGATLCARVVAVAGDEVDITDQGLVVNGTRVQETGIFEETTQVEGGVTFPVTVGAGQVFVLGDARTRATDSRIAGCIDAADTQGTVVGIFRRRGI